MTMHESTESRRRFTFGRVLWVVLGLVLLATFLTLLSLGLTSQAEVTPFDSPFAVPAVSAGQEKGWTASDHSPNASMALSQTLHLPFVSRSGGKSLPAPPMAPPGAVLITVPLGAPPLVMTGKGTSLKEAQARPTFWLDSQSLYASVHHPDGYYPFYSVARTYLAFEPEALQEISWERVVQADLVLYPNANDDACSQVDVQIHAGIWEHLDASAWAALGQPLATFRGDDAVTTPFTVTLTGAEDLAKMIMTVDEGAIPPQSCSLNTLKAGFFAADPGSGAATHLAIWVKEE